MSSSPTSIRRRRSCRRPTLPKSNERPNSSAGRKKGTPPAKGGKIWNDGKEVCTWKAACGLLGMMGIETTGEGPKDDGLTSEQVGGVQMADVSVDTKTGIVRMNQFVAVQDCGLIVDLLTAK